MPYETHDTKSDCTYRRPDEPEVYYSANGIQGCVAHMRLGDRWAASVCHANGKPKTLGIFATREEARNALRKQGIWDGLPHA